MKTLQKHLVLNKREDYRELMARGVVHEGDSLRLDEGARHGFICLGALDGGENGFPWGRLSLECEIPQDSLIRTWAYAADVVTYGDFPTLDEYVASLEKEQDACETLCTVYMRCGDGDDCDLALSGRYLYLMFEFISPGRSPRLDAVRLHLFGDHMTDYLPAIYRKNGDFTRRFLSVFDSMLMDLEHDVYALPSRFDYEEAHGALLSRLSQWVCIEPGRQDGAAMLESIRTALSDHEEMYTVRGVKRSVRRLTGREPYIIECSAVDPNRADCADSEVYRRLYGENPYKFFVLLDEDAFASREQMEEFLTDMQGLIPAGTEFELVLLKRCVQLDRHTYLGVNTMVSDYVPVVIDENKTIHYDTMIGGDIS